MASRSLPQGLSQYTICPSNYGESQAQASSALSSQPAGSVNSLLLSKLLTMLRTGSCWISTPASSRRLFQTSGKFQVRIQPSQPSSGPSSTASILKCTLCYGPEDPAPFIPAMQLTSAGLCLLHTLHQGCAHSLVLSHLCCRVSWMNKHPQTGVHTPPRLCCPWACTDAGMLPLMNTYLLSSSLRKLCWALELQ